MSIKFKCNCGHVLSVPDEMAGKSGKCPKCKNSLKVPVPKNAASKNAASKTAAPQGAVASGKPSSGKKRPAPAAASPAMPAGVMDSLFDDVGLTKKIGPTCPNCGSSIRPGAVVCTSCGLHLESGESLKGFNAKKEGQEFDNQHLQLAADNMRRDLVMDDRRAKAAMPWWVVMSFLIGAITLCAAGVVIVDGMVGTPADESTFLGKVQRWPVFITIGLTACVTGVAIVFFAHLSICAFGFSRSLKQGFACFFLPLLYSFVYGVMSWTDNKAPVKAIMMAMAFIGFGVFLIIQGGGFQLVIDAF